MSHNLQTTGQACITDGLWQLFRPLRLVWQVLLCHAVPTHQTLQAFQEKRPQLGANTFVAPNASVIGDVKLGSNSSVWYGAVLRGEAFPAPSLCCGIAADVLFPAPHVQSMRNHAIAWYSVQGTSTAYRLEITATSRTGSQYMLPGTTLRAISCLP
jgi:hypothetical protein